MLIDSHVHLASYSDGEIGEVIQRAKDVGVRFVISAGTTLESSRRSVELADTLPEFFAGVGIHPMDIREPMNDETYRQLLQMVNSSEKVIVISEIGLDFMEGTPDREVQYHAFREQIRLARQVGLPIVFHSRESHDEVFRVLREEKAYEVGGVMHYFQGDEATAAKAIDLGFYVSLARPLLRLPNLQTVAASLPLERIVLETDSAPQPFKGKRENWTEPRHTREVAERLAELQGRPIEEIEAATSRNIRDLLGDRWSVVEKYIGAEEPSL